MAYGKIKADTLVYDNSGSDVEVTLSSLGNKAGLNSPTFTGTPTVPGYAPLASPALTGTATAVNLTMSGNLTVNGTTTTVASTNTTITDNLLELNSGASSNANDSGILIERGSTGDNAIIAWDESADKFIVGTTTGTASSTGDITIATGTLVATVEGTATGLAGSPNITCGTVSDSKGNLRSIPANTQGSNYSLASSDAGKCVLFAGTTLSVPTDVGFVSGDAVTIVNNSASEMSFSLGGAMTMYNTADGTEPSKLAARGMATIYFVSNTVSYISGAGLS